MRIRMRSCAAAENRLRRAEAALDSQEAYSVKTTKIEQIFANLSCPSKVFYYSFRCAQGCPRGCKLQLVIENSTGRGRWCKQSADIFS